MASTTGLARVEGDELRSRLLQPTKMKARIDQLKSGGSSSSSVGSGSDLSRGSSFDYGSSINSMPALAAPNSSRRNLGSMNLAQQEDASAGMSEHTISLIIGAIVAIIVVIAALVVISK
ncbi:hypothetical protein M427DRAFT_27822 [Gonapodya prolifera JEL478]|uniref:Uncharacterized protein n=1 Tax=Gonapodya prolifera (strain JEL478) TaxID=1344416 RepID=A0A139AVU6_GONPJ|nr:hypothetical protein M427DRAFT_27822 [Gonapodya prolifera JEL478]|eukprot:KXS20703.1 hypothetical protein M427DRAFT_27822 [Gonapodya prolifera JEL478]